jgi:hypothetical protein
MPLQVVLLSSGVETDRMRSGDGCLREQRVEGGWCSPHDMISFSLREKVAAKRSDEGLRPLG